MAVQSCVETACSSVEARIDQLANEMKDKNTGSPNTVPTAEHAQKMETKLGLAKSVIKMLMQPYHAAGSVVVVGTPLPVKGVLEPYVAGAKMMAKQPNFGFSKEEIKDLFGPPPEDDDE